MGTCSFLLSYCRLLYMWWGPPPGTTCPRSEGRNPHEKYIYKAEYNIYKIFTTYTTDYHLNPKPKDNLIPNLLRENRLPKILYLYSVTELNQDSPSLRRRHIPKPIPFVYRPRPPTTTTFLTVAPCLALYFAPAAYASYTSLLIPVPAVHPLTESISNTWFKCGITIIIISERIPYRIVRRERCGPYHS